MRVDFYQLLRDPAETILPAIAQKILDQNEKLLIVSADEHQRGRISRNLWEAKATSFLAHGSASGDNAAFQPILLSETEEAINRAKYIAIADGDWRDGLDGFERIFFLFPPEKVDGARAAWRALAAHESAEPKFWKQDGGRWVEGP